MSDATFQLHFTLSDRTLPGDGDKFVLDAALAAGLKLPFLCRRGICGTCKSKLISGDIDMHQKGALRPRDIEAGFFLPCCSKPRSDLMIEK